MVYFQITPWSKGSNSWSIFENAMVCFGAAKLLRCIAFSIPSDSNEAFDFRICLKAGKSSWRVQSLPYFEKKREKK